MAGSYSSSAMVEMVWSPQKLLATKGGFEVLEAALAAENWNEIGGKWRGQR